MTRLLTILLLALPLHAATLQWDASPYATSYNVYSNNVRVATTVNTSWTLPEITGTSVWHVTAFDSLSESEPSTKLFVMFFWTPIP